MFDFDEKGTGMNVDEDDCFFCLILLSFITMMQRMAILCIIKEFFLQKKQRRLSRGDKRLCFLWRYVSLSEARRDFEAEIRLW